MARSARRHHRAAAREQIYKPSKGTFIPRAAQPRLIAVAIIALVLVFTKGLLAGMLLAKKN